MYEYNCQVTRIIDGDTVEVVLDLGFHVTFKTTLRLWGINAPETRGPDKQKGLAATAHLSHLVTSHSTGPGCLQVRTIKDTTEKYGRYLAVLYAGSVDLNAQMVADGYAVSYMVSPAGI